MTVTLDSLKKSIGKKNAKSEVFAWIADLERAAGNLDGALQRVDGGLTLYPNDVAAMIVRAKILFQQEKFDDCVKQCEEILTKDTFSLAGQKIMGDAYDKLGNVSERNRCYRRYHDMDPLNTFWKDEYDVVDAAMAASVVAGSDIPEDEFSMPDDSGLTIKTLDEQESENAASMGEGAQEMPAQGIFNEGDQSSVGSAFEKSFDEALGTLGSDDAPAEENGGLFEKSASSMDITLDEEEKPAEGADLFGDNATENAPEESHEDDPFAALNAMLPNNDAAEDSMMEDVTASLNAAMETISLEGDDDKPKEEFPADDEISGGDVNSALSDMFGIEDDLEAEETPAAASTIEAPVDESATANASMVFGSAPVEDKPMSVDSAFNSIFGEDELPEEKPQVKPADKQNVPDEDKPMSVDNAFDSIFGEDELPEEKPQEKAEEQPLEMPEEKLDLPGEDKLDFSAEDKLELPAEDKFELPAEEKAFEEPSAFEKSASEDVSLGAPATEDKPMSVDNAFDSIFGEDELPEEKLDLPGEDKLELPAEDKFELPAEEKAFEEPSAFEKSASEDVSLGAPAAEDKSLSVDSAFDSIFGADDDLPEEKPQEKTVEQPLEMPEEKLDLPGEDKLDLPAEDKLELPVEEKLDVSAEDDVALNGEWNPDPKGKHFEEDSLELPADEQPAKEVNSAFDSIFGADDDLPEEKPSMVKEVNEPTEPVITSAMDFVLNDEPVAEAPAAEESTFEKSLEESPAVEQPAEPAKEGGFSVDSAFDSLFGSDDDLPAEEKPEEAPAAEETSLTEQVNKAETELEMPSIEKEDSSDLAKEMGGAFASMFGDDDLDLPETKSGENDLKPSAANDQQATGAAFEEASENKLESDLDKSFSSLFGNDDDLSLPTEKASETSAVETAKEAPVQDATATQNVDSLESEVNGAFKGLFDMDDDSLGSDSDKPSNSGVDFLMSGDSDDEVSAGLIRDPNAPLNRGGDALNESLNTKTLAEIYFDQGLYGKALDIYKDLAQKEPENKEIADRMAEVEKLYKEKFGGNG